MQKAGTVMSMIRGSEWSFKKRKSRQNRVSSRNLVIFFAMPRSLVSIVTLSFSESGIFLRFSCRKASVSDYSLLSKVSGSDFKKAISASRTISDLPFATPTTPKLLQLNYNYNLISQHFILVMLISLLELL